jgi:NitT/TauT family transport system permease protein
LSSVARLGKRLRSAATGLVLPLVLVLIWEACARAGLFSAVVLPAPSAVLQKGWQSLQPVAPWDPAQQSRLAWLLSGELVDDAIASLSRVLMGFGVGAGLALPLGLLMGASPRLFALCDPLLQVLRPIPPIAYIPLAILWFGLGNPPAVFLIALGAFFPVLMNTIAGVRQVDGIYLRAARNLGVGQRTLFLRVMLPAAMP